MVRMTPFVRAVVDLLKAAPHQSMDAYTLREALMEKGFGKHPAGVAMNLTKLAYKQQYVTSYIDNGDCRVFLLTSEGRSA